MYTDPNNTPPVYNSDSQYTVSFPAGSMDDSSQMDDLNTIPVSTNHDAEVSTSIYQQTIPLGGQAPTIPMTPGAAAPGGSEPDSKTILIRPNDNGDNPVSPFGAPVQDPNAPLNPEEWVHGWLVAISGPMKGKFFPILYGRNQVGRSPECRICLPDDPSISSKQFIIRFKEKNRCFTVKAHSDSKQNTFLADGEDLDDESTIIEMGDTLKLSSETTLRFVPFCDSDFMWDYSVKPTQLMPTSPMPFAPSMYPGYDSGKTIPIDLDSNTGIGRSDIFANSSITTAVTTRPIDLAGAATPPTIKMGTDAPASDKTQLIRKAPAAPADAYSPAYPADPFGMMENKELEPEEWVQGWLVAITGPMMGRSYPLFYGRNQVGRNPECRICLPADPFISGKQLIIRYKAKNKSYSVVDHSDARQITILNNEIELDDPEKIERGDILKLSEHTTLRFVPFCDASFAWDYPENTK